jgi:hypothetical protein
VYRYWQQKPVGVLTSFTEPHGECSDFNGNVYITDRGADAIYEYEHSATKPFHTIDESPAVPYDCAISPKTGDLAVANRNSGYNTPGTIDVYRKGKGKPIAYRASNDDHFIFCAYDDSGDLFALSENLSYSFSYFEYDFYYLPKNSTKMILMFIPAPYSSYNGPWDTIYGLGWDGKYWTILSKNTLYQFTIDVKAQQVGEVKLATSSGNIDGPVSFYRLTARSVATQVVGPDLGGTVDYWHYPAGGSPIGAIGEDLDEPFGVAISLKTGS